jgi:hypothetical protein
MCNTTEGTPRKPLPRLAPDGPGNTKMHNKAMSKSNKQITMWGKIRGKKETK